MHAKVYVFGSSAVITSANLTQSAFYLNVEVGVEVSDVSEIAAWFDRLWSSASMLTVDQLDQWQLLVTELRQEYATLSNKAASILSLPDELNIRVNEASVEYYFCNTDRVASKRTATGFSLENAMRSRGFVAAWIPFAYPTRMESVRPGDIIFMYANQKGIIGIGKAIGQREILAVGQRGRIRDDYHGEEWRIPVQWLAWRESDPFGPVVSRQTFRSITHNKRLINGVIEHFFGT